MRFRQRLVLDPVLSHNHMGVALFLVLVPCLSQVTCHTSTSDNETVPLFSNGPVDQLWSHTTISQWKLRVCGTETKASTLMQLESGKVRIPMFSVDQLAYDFVEYEIDRDNPVLACVNDDDLSASNRGHYTMVTLLPIEEYDKKSGTKDFPFDVLRSEPLLLDNGYLSVGDREEEAAWFYAPGEYCLARVSNTEQGSKGTFFQFRTCPFQKTRPVFRKCCPMGMVIVDFSCEPYPAPENWQPFYIDAESKQFLPFDQVNPVYMSPRVPCDPESWRADKCHHEFHPVTDNRVAFVGAFRTWEFFSEHINWCMDIVLNETDTEHQEQLSLFYCASNETKVDDGRKQIKLSVMYTVSVYVGAGFHLLTSLVYLITWPRQNIHGKTLSSCTTSLFFMQLFLGTTHLLSLIGNHLRTELCLAISLGGQYFFIAAFTWLLVVNFDLWRTFRTIRPGGKGQQDMRRFWGYSALGWGFPLLVSVISITLNFTFPCRTSRVPTPEFGQHHHCFVAPWAQGIYVFYILGVLIAISCVFAGWTLVSLSRVKQKTTHLRSNRQDANQQTVRLFIKLSVIQGFSWLFEVIGWAVSRYKQEENFLDWIILGLDFYNALSAILIFLIFVCKQSTLTLLEQSVPQLKGLIATLNKCTSCSNFHKKSTGASCSINKINEEGKTCIPLMSTALGEENVD